MGLINDVQARNSAISQWASRLKAQWPNGTRRRPVLSLDVVPRQMFDLTPQLVSVNEEPSHERLYANRGLLDYLGATLDEWRQSSRQAEHF